VLARALALALLAVATAAAEVPVPALSARVTDLTGTLDAGQRAALEARLSAFERAKGSQVVVLLVPTTQPEEIEQYSIRVAEAWKIGRRRGIDDGVIVVVAIDDRAVRIEVGDGLEGALPDAIANRITDDVIVPRFRASDYYGGLSDGVERIIGAIEGEPLPPPSSPRGIGGLPNEDVLWTIVPIPLLIGGLVRLIHNRYSGSTVAGALGAGLGWWFTGAASVALVAAFICFFFILAAGSHRGSWSSRGGWGGHSGGGGGGFSGGGGHFSGGGATGRW
jgi:uncharacterized protein